MTKLEQPNIVLITTDQQRFDTSGAHAPAFLRTPHLDQLAREGVTFDRAYADNPLCVPSRVSIMSGSSVWRHRMLNNGVSSDVLAGATTLPALMRDAGYQTMAIGKMHFGPERARHGFDETILPADYYREMRDRGITAQPMRHGLGQNELFPGMATVPESQTLTAWLCDQAALFVRERRDPTRPFFLWLSLSKPHPPLDPPEPYYSMYRTQDIPVPDVGDWADDDSSPAAINWIRHKESYDLLHQGLIREARAAYYGLVTQIDYNLGRVFASLQDKELLQEALLLFTSDHGEYLGDHRLGNKIFFHDVSARVPMILRLPKSRPDLPRGETVHGLATHADILPTLVTAARGHIPAWVDGIDLVELAQDAARRPNLTAMSAGADLDSKDPWYFAITDGEWKYIWYPAGAAEQLFDLASDPHECRNRAQHPEVAAVKARLRDQLLAKCRGDAADLLDDGEFPVRDVPAMPTTEQRTHSWPGYHTEFYELDVRH